MIRDFFTLLSGWSSLDTWIVATASLAAMACAVPGVFLFVRRQSMYGDALSHTALPGIAIAFLAALWGRNLGWISEDTYVTWRHGFLVAGAALIGIVSALLTEGIQKVGRVEANAALGVVFTSLFALGLLLVRLAADKVDLDPDCVLYGTVETAVLDTVAGTSIPQAAVMSGLALLANLVLAILFFKELRLAAFDPALATSMGINAHAVHYALTTMTAITLVAAFESVGSILVIAMLVVPAATAHLLTDQLGKLLAIALAVAAISAALGHALAITLPAIVFHRLGIPEVLDASTAGMMAVAVGLLFSAAALFSPKYGVVSRTAHRLRLSIQVAAEDLLGVVYRQEEQPPSGKSEMAVPGVRAPLEYVAWRWLKSRGELIDQDGELALTDRGRRRAELLVRSHRLWESYMAKHLPLPDDHLHATAERVEHFIDGQIRAEIAAELATPDQDPHGRAIPAESDESPQ